MIRNLFFVALCLICFYSSTEAATIILSDFDGTILAVEGNSTFGTYYKLYRVERRITVLQPVPKGPEVFWISTGDYEQYKNLLAKAQDRPGYIAKEVALKDAVDPKTKKPLASFRPGEYEIRTPDSFEFFMEGHSILEDFKRAEKKDPTGKTWKGRYWYLMVEALSDPDSAKGFGLVTARSQSIAEWKELFSYWIKKKYIKYHPNYNLFKNLSRPEFDQFDTAYDIGEKKRATLEKAVQALRLLSIDEPARLSPDGDQTIPAHFIIIPEDNQDMVEIYYREMDKRARNRIRGVELKFGLYNAGTDEEVLRTGRPRLAILKNSGLTREATPAEAKGEFLKPIVQKQQQESCVKKLKRRGRGAK